jgi:GMP synthase (glutamine-hydrolysing)
MTKTSLAKTCLAVRHVAFEDLGLLGPLVAAHGYDIHYHDAGIDRFDAETLVAPDLLIVLGGPIGVYECETYPFIDGEIAAVAARLSSNKPMLGICLGAQMMAAALGARVAPGPAKEIGWAPLTLTAAGLASVLSPHSPVQAFARTPSQLALQFHLETEPARFESWLVGHTVELGKAGIDPRDVRSQVHTVGAASLEVGRKVLAAWLDSLGTVG